MKFAGAVARKFELKGTENLPALVSRFTQNTHPNIDLLSQREFNALRGKIDDLQAKIVQQVDRMVHSVHFAYESPDVRSAVDDLVEQYMCAEPDQRYDRISPSMFKLGRQVTVRVESDSGKYSSDSGKYSVDTTIPLFATAPYGEGKPWHVTKVVRDDWRHAYRVSFSSDQPPITVDAKERAKQARAGFAEVYAKALRVPVIGDIISSDAAKFSTTGLDLEVVWIPKPSDLHMHSRALRDPDPLLIGTFFGRHYLIAQWDVAGEEPYQHYLAEFRKPR